LELIRKRKGQADLQKSLTSTLCLVYPYINIKSYHLFRKTRTQKVYRLLKEYRNTRILSILFAKLLLGEKVKLIVDGTILEVAKPKQGKDTKDKAIFWQSLLR
jgi:hypothetical protein